MSVFLCAFNKAIADELQFKLTQRRPPLSLNPQQEAILIWAGQGSGSANIIARAGCGKSTTLLELARQVDERAYASTFHSIGLKLWRQFKSRSEIDGNKTKNLAKTVFPWDKKLAGLLAEAVSFGKQSAFGVLGALAGDETDWENLIDYYGIDDEITQISTQRFVAECMKVYKRSLDMCVDQESVIDFDDMLLAPLYYGQNARPSAQYDWVFVDEAQDTNKSRRMLAKWILKPGGRMIAVGDPGQAIYHFAGASSNAMDLIKADMQAVEMPLNITYRCPKLIVQMAQSWVPDFTAHDSAPDGVIRTIDHSDLWLEKFRTDGRDAILCRNTRPLVGIAVRLREAGIPCVVEGQSGQAIIALVTKWGEITIGDLIDRVDMWRSEQVKKWQAKGRMDKVEGIEERCGTVTMLARQCGEGATVQRLVQKIEMLFGQDNRTDVIRLCTIHRSKGREWDRVFLIGRNMYQPSRYAESDEELQQERNLEYVAVTRVKKELVEVVVPAKKSAEMPDWWEA